MSDIIDFNDYTTNKVRNDARKLQEFLTSGKSDNCRNALATSNCLHCNKCHKFGRTDNED